MRPKGEARGRAKSFFGRMVSQRSLFEREGLEIEENREMFFDDITKLIRDFKYKLRLKQYFIKEKDPDKVATEISYAYVIQYILYKTLVDDDYSDKKNEFLERFKVVHKSLKENIFGEVLSQATHIAEYISENLYRPFSAEQQYIEERLKEIKRKTKNSISDISPWLDIFIFIKKYNFASVRNELFGYIYENYLKELHGDKNKGQYFTDPAVVEFMLDEIGYTADEIKKRIKDKPDNPDISIIDPACGSGTFLYSAAKRIIDAVYKGDEKTAKQAENLISENIFGLDIEEFPLYLAEMGILMKMLPLIVNEKYNNPMDKKIKLFKTEDSISEFVDMMHSISEKGGQKELFVGHKLEVSKFMRDEENLTEMKDSMRPPRRRFDFVIGNPPYIGYNECCKQKLEFTKLMKQNNLSMGNIYGVNLHSAPKRRKTYSPKPNIYAFFIALGLSLLKKNSRMSYIIPQTILMAGDLDVLRYHLSKETAIETLITFAGKMFIGRGLKQQNPVATSSLIFVVNSNFTNGNNTRIINYNSTLLDIETTIEEIFSKNEVTVKNIPQSVLSKNVTNWNFITHEKSLLDIYESYKKKTESCSIYYHHALAEPTFKQRFYFDIGFTLNTNEIKGDIGKDLYELLDFKCFNGYSSFLPKEHYPKDISKIKLTQNSQGYVVLEQKHKIVWSVKNPDRFCYTDHPIIFYMGKAAIICSNYKEEILYLMSLLNSFVIMA